MKRLFPLATLLVLLYVGYTYALPYIQGTFRNDEGPTVSGMNEGAICVRKVQQTAQFFGRQWHKFEKPPINETKFEASMAEVLNRIELVEPECRCNGEACQQGLTSLKTLRGTVTTYRKRVKAGNTAPPNLNGYREQVKKAARQARSESTF